MKIYLKQLSLTNFKGIRSLKISFNHVTNIYGQNATGKTTLMDAFLWLFFGKDSSDRKDFEIKTLDEKNEPYHRLDHEVAAVMSIDDDEINIRRVFKEKWVTKRGESTPVFSGHTTEFYWNGVPMKESEFQAKVASILNENIFKLVTNTTYFNSLKWQDRRDVLLKIAGDISDADVAAGNSDFLQLLSTIKGKKSMDEYKREIIQKKKLIKGDLELFPARIDEANRSLPEEKDYDNVEKQIESLKAELDTVDGLLMDKTNAEMEHQKTISKKINEVGELKRRGQEIEFSEKNSQADKKRVREKVIMDKKRDLRNKQDERARLLSEYNSEGKRLAALEMLKAELVKKWEAINADQLVFNENDFHCPACKRAYETTDVEAKKLELTNNYNTDKSKRLAEVTERGQKAADDIKIIEANLGNITDKGLVLKSEIELLENDINILEQENIRLATNEEQELQESLSGNSEYIAINEMIRLLNEEIKTPYSKEDNTELISRKKAFQLNIAELQKELATKDQRIRILNRITELKTQEAAMAQELATLEGIEFTILQFEKAKMDELENRVNGRFNIVQFKLFQKNINGGEEPACITLVKGVPYPDANTAGKIQAGLEIINVLQDHFNVMAPVWVDNRESVIELPETNAQLINLVVSAKHKKLTIGEEQEKLEMA